MNTVIDMMIWTIAILIQTCSSQGWIYLGNYIGWSRGICRVNQRPNGFE